MLTWHYITLNDYNNMSDELKLSNKLFFIKDTKEIFCGTDMFRDYVIVYNNEPTTNYIGKLYVNGYTLEGKIFDSGNWLNVIDPVRNYKTDNFISNDDIAHISYDNGAKLLVITFIDGTVDIISMDNLVIDLMYGKSTGEFAIDYIFALSTNHNKMVNLHDYITDIEYDHENKNSITINFKDKNGIIIDIDGCIEDSEDDIVGFSITGNMFIAECILAANEDNMIIENDAIYVVCKNNYTIISDENIDKETIINNSADTVDIAVKDIIDTLQASYSEYNFSVGSGHDGEIIVADSAGIPTASGIKIGGSSLSIPPAEDLVATEIAVSKYVEDNTIPVEKIVHYKELTNDDSKVSDTDIISEKAFMETIKWHII